MITVAVISDVRLYREGVAHLLAGSDGIEVRVSAASGPQAINEVASHQPDIVILDMGATHALAVLQLIRHAAPAVRVVGITVGENESDILNSIEAGAAGYVMREQSHADLLLVLHSVLRKETICSPGVAAKLMKRLADLAAGQKPTGLVDGLTSRERQIARLLAEGMTNKQIADALSIQLATVKNHVHNILCKLQLDRRAQAAALLSARSLSQGSQPVGATSPAGLSSPVSPHRHDATADVWRSNPGDPATPTTLVEFISRKGGSGGDPGL